MPWQRIRDVPLVGRAAELARLHDWMGLDGRPRGGAVLLAGDAGVGKTRLVDAALDAARGAGWRTAAGHCLDLGDGAPPYLPFREALGQLAPEPEVRHALERRPALGRLVDAGSAGSPGPVAADVARRERALLFEAVHAALDELASSHPLLMVVEDLHWAERSTREMLSFLFTRSFTSPVFVLGTYRSDDLHRRHPLRRAVAEWARLPGVHRLTVPPLSRSAVRDLVRTLARPLPEHQVADIVARAEGNAFFVEELVAAAEHGETALPDDLAGLLLVRLEQLDSDTIQVLHAASVAGRQVSHALLSRVVELDPARLDRALRAAVDAHLLVPAAEEGYAFRHALLAEAVYDDLLPGERVRLHAAYVEALRSAQPSAPAELARHARAANDMVTAVRASLEAGDAALGVAGPDEAAQHFETALGLLADPSTSAGVAAEGEEVDRVRLVIRAATAAAAAGHLLRAVRLLQEQLAELAADAPPLSRAELMHALASMAMYTDLDVDAPGLVARALQLVPADPPTRLRAELSSANARVSAVRLRDEDTVRWAEEAIRLAEQLDLPDVAADAATTLARLEDRIGDPNQSRTALQEALDRSRRSGEVGAELRARYNFAMLAFEDGRLDEAYEAYVSTWHRARGRGRPWGPYGIDARAMAALTAYTMGRWDDADHLVDTSTEAAPGMAEAVLTAVRLTLAAGRGDTDALGEFPGLRPWWDKDGMIAIVGGGAVIDLYGDAGDLDAAVTAHDDAVALVADLWQQPAFEARVRFSALLLGQLATRITSVASADRPPLLQRGDELRVAAEQAVATVGQRRKRLGVETVAWRDRMLAEHSRLRWLAGVDSPAAEELRSAWERAVAGFERLGHVFEIARSQARLAEVLQAVGAAPADVDGRRQAARATAERLGAVPLLRELRRAPGRPDDTGKPRNLRLTAREREVLTLVSAGRSNKQIAQQLYISAKTVSVHVSNILTKLGASGRTEAAALARRDGLLP